MILVTGATGFAGRHLLDRLPSSSRITAWARPGGQRPPVESRAQWSEVDLLDAGSVARAIQAARPSTIYHLAGAPHVGSSFADPVPHLEINAVGTHNLLKAVEQNAPHARTVIVTSAMIYRPSSQAHTESSPLLPNSPYGLSKMAQDRLAALAAEEGLNVTLARPFNHTGPGQDPSFAIPGFAQQIARIEAGHAEPVIRVGNLDAERDLSDVRDVVDAYEAIAARGATGTPYNVCAGQAWRIGDLLEMLLSRARVPVRIEVDEARLRPIEMPRLIGDNERLCGIGWTPRIPIETTLDDVLEYWRTHTA